MNTLRLITLVILAKDFANTVDRFGAKNIIAVANSRNSDNVLLIGKIDAEKVDTLQGEVTRNEDAGVDIKVDIDSSKWSQLGSIERRNGFYALIADTDYAKTSAFDTILNQIRNKEVAAFDTTFGHTDGVKKKCWVAPMGKAPKLIHVDTKNVTAARFNLTGLVLTTDSDTQLKAISYSALDNWYDSTEGNAKTDTVFDCGTAIRSLSHINGNTLVVNTEDGKYVLDLTPMRDNVAPELITKDIEHLGLNFVGFLNPNVDEVTYVSFGNQPVARFVPTKQLTLAMQTYTNQDAAAAK